MPRALREPLSPEQHHLLEAIFEPFDQTGSWPIWQYVDLTLDGRFGLDARDVLASLPVARDPNPVRWSSRYELTWRMDSHMEPQPDNRIALTVAGLRYMPQAESLLGAFLTAVQHLVEATARPGPVPRHGGRGDCDQRGDR